MEELPGLPGERLIRFENEGHDSRRFDFSGGEFQFHEETLVEKRTFSNRPR
jgi:hypothetical protein